MHIQRLDPANRQDVRRYLAFSARLYRGSPLWVPPFVDEARSQLDPRRHPFYEHSEAAFFMAFQGDEVAGRVAVLDNSRYNAHHGERTAFFYHFDAVNDHTVSQALFDAAADWARGRGLERMWGPKGFAPGDGQGLLVEGFEHRPALGIAYNFPYYDDLLKGAGFEKKLDFVSAYLDREMGLPPRFLEVAERIKRRRGFRTLSFGTKAELRAMIPRLASVYNESFVEIQGFVPITESEAELFAGRILAIADPALIKLLMKGDEIVGFVIAYPDITAAIRRCGGRLWPTGWYHLMREFKRTKWLNLNGAAILGRHRGLGGNALLYAEMYHTLSTRPQYQYADLVQVQETNLRMIQELEAVGVKPYKKHRLYQRSLT